jgi:hypothetical protein
MGALFHVMYVKYYELISTKVIHLKSGLFFNSVKTGNSTASIRKYRQLTFELLAEQL